MKITCHMVNLRVLSLKLHQHVPYMINERYRIAGNFRGRKLSWIGKKWPFCGENFCGILKPINRWVRHAQISRRKLSRVALKLRNSWMFSPSKVFRYTVVSIINVHCFNTGSNIRRCSWSWSCNSSSVSSCSCSYSCSYYSCSSSWRR